ncbi:hypothetical protein KFE25_014031 [Diacronema lutheri]|uniref:G domain-containing protein n=2 Tax=Diacronema lutheri TaxID=2081491 RepID=A0A8J5XE12_DIALT|nr:hypothetical protein KFE25_014031 [Diacronema lutheri]
MAPGRRLLRVALLGLTNSGKSTLCNALVGEEVTIATAKRHTTRSRVRAIFVEREAQVVLSDTPGVLELDRESRRERSRNPLAFKPLKAAAPDALRDAHLHLLVVDASATDSVARAEHTGRELARLRTLGAAPDDARDGGAGVILALNKVDRLNTSDRVPKLARRLAEACQVSPLAVCPISALGGPAGAGIAELRRVLVEAAVPSEWDFADPDQRSDLTLGERALDILRAEIHHALHRQLPYAVRSEEVRWAEERETGAILLEVELSMPHFSELAVLRSALGTIHRAAQARLVELFGRQVQLALHTRLRSARG